MAQSIATLILSIGFFLVEKAVRKINNRLDLIEKRLEKKESK